MALETIGAIGVLTAAVATVARPAWRTGKRIGRWLDRFGWW